MIYNFYVIWLKLGLGNNISQKYIVNVCDLSEPLENNHQEESWTSLECAK